MTRRACAVGIWDKCPPDGRSSQWGGSDVEANPVTEEWENGPRDLGLSRGHQEGGWQEARSDREGANHCAGGSGRQSGRQ